VVGGERGEPMLQEADAIPLIGSVDNFHQPRRMVSLHVGA